MTFMNGFGRSLPREINFRTRPCVAKHGTNFMRNNGAWRSSQ